MAAISRSITLDSLAAVTEDERRKRGLTIRRLCRQLGIAEATYRRWQSGRVPRPGSLLDRPLADFLGYPREQVEAQHEEEWRRAQARMQEQTLTAAPSGR